MKIFKYIFGGFIKKIIFVFAISVLADISMAQAGIKYTIKVESACSSKCMSGESFYRDNMLRNEMESVANERWSLDKKKRLFQ